MVKTITKTGLVGLLIGALIISLTINVVYAQSATTVTFDFDTGTPALASQGTPFSQTSNGVTATFSSPSDPAAFSVQRYATTSFKLAQFSGNYLYDSSSYRDILEIKFNAAVTSITFTFATIEFHGGTGVEPTNITLTAYLDSTATAPIGSMKARGTWPNGDTYPQGTLTYNSNQQFNLVRIEVPFQGPTAAIDYLIDTVVIVTTSQPTPTPTPVTTPATTPGATPVQTPTPSLPPTAPALTPSTSPLSTPNPTSMPSSSPAPTQSLQPVSTVNPANGSSPNPSPSIPEFPLAVVIALLTLAATVAVLFTSKKLPRKVNSS